MIVSLVIGHGPLMDLNTRYAKNRLRISRFGSFSDAFAHRVETRGSRSLLDELPDAVDGSRWHVRQQHFWTRGFFIGPGGYFVAECREAVS